MNPNTTPEEMAAALAQQLKDLVDEMGRGKLENRREPDLGVSHEPTHTGRNGAWSS